MSSAEKIAAGACIYVCIYACITSIYVPTYIANCCVYLGVHRWLRRLLLVRVFMYAYMHA